MNSCKNFLGLRFNGDPSCAMGHDVRKLAVDGNGGSEFGIAFGLPCTKRKEGAKEPLFSCPDLDRLTDEEVKDKRAKVDESLRRFTELVPRLVAMKKKMIKHKIPKAVATCVWCGGKDKLKLRVNLGGNKHMMASCSSCGEGFME